MKPTPDKHGARRERSAYVHPSWPGVVIVAAAGMLLCAASSIGTPAWQNAAGVACVVAYVVTAIVTWRGGGLARAFLTLLVGGLLAQLGTVVWLATVMGYW